MSSRKLLKPFTPRTAMLRWLSGAKTLFLHLKFEPKYLNTYLELDSVYEKN